MWSVLNLDIIQIPDALESNDDHLSEIQTTAFKLSLYSEGQNLATILPKMLKFCCLDSRQKSSFEIRMG